MSHNLAEQKERDDNAQISTLAIIDPPLAAGI
jgi:hypothetical protein